MRPQPPEPTRPLPARTGSVADVCRVGPALRSGNSLSRRDAGPDERGDLLPRSLEGRDDHQVVRHIVCSAIGRTGMPRNSCRCRRRRSRPAPDRTPAATGTRARAASPRPQIATRRPAAAHSCSTIAQMLPHFTVQMQRIVHELVREPRLLGDAARCNQVGDAVRCTFTHLM